jgi:hypothetical protein
MHLEKAKAAAAGPCWALAPVVVDGPDEPQPATTAQTAAHARIDRDVVCIDPFLFLADERAICRRRAVTGR